MIVSSGGGGLPQDGPGRLARSSGGDRLPVALAEAPFWPHLERGDPDLVPQDQVSWANSLVAIGRSIGIMVGPAVGDPARRRRRPSVFTVTPRRSWSPRHWSCRSAPPSWAIDRTKEASGVWAGFGSCSTSRCCDGSRWPGWTLVLGIGMALVGDVLVDVFGAGSAGSG
jgi:hypothetical protein